MAGGGPQETYIVPTGAQPKGAAPPSPEPSSAAVMPEDPPGAPTVDGGGSAGDIPMGVDEGCGPTSNYSSKITLTPENSTLISGTISGGVSPNGPFLIDLMDVEGTQLYSLMCTRLSLNSVSPQTITLPDWHSLKMPTRTVLLKQTSKRCLI